MKTTLSRNSLLHAVQCVAAMSRFMEEYLARPSATTVERESLGELIMDLDGVLDNLSTAYEELRAEDSQSPALESLLDAYSGYTLAKKL